MFKVPLLVFLACLILPLALKAQSIRDTLPARGVLFSDNFDNGKIEYLNSFGAKAVLEKMDGSSALQSEGDSQIFYGAANDKTKMVRDVTIEGDVSVERNNVNSGFMVRASRQVEGNAWNGYYASYRKLSAGYGIVQLFRFPQFVLLQEARVRGEVKVNQMVHLKVTCQGPNIWVWANDMSAPAISEYDDTYLLPGFVGLKADNKAFFDNIVVSTVSETPRKPLVRDWSWVKGAVFITSSSVNSYQMWEEYDPKVIDRELFYARVYGLNVVQVYLNFLTWQRYGRVYLSRVEDFLRRADKYGLKVTFVFFDDVGNIEPPHLAPYSAPVPGVHNSQMQGSPGRAIVDNHSAEFRESLNNYVQAVVKAHKADARIICWQTYNEPSHATTLPLLKDSYGWIKQTGSTIPVSATGGGAFYGSYYSDFPTFHSYLDPKAELSQSMVLAEGGSEHLCTETLDRPGVDVPKLVNYFSARKTGWIIWELMIGRNGTRFPWGSSHGAPEPQTPFHGLIYPDGHPWSLNDIKMIRGDVSGIPVLDVNYYSDISFGNLKKISVVPRIDFDLDTEPGTAASDASEGIADTKWSNRYKGKVVPARTGIYTFFVDSDGIVRVWIDGKQVINKTELNTRREVSGRIQLRAGHSSQLVLEYAHDVGRANLHLRWSGPGTAKQILAGHR